MRWRKTTSSTLQQDGSVPIPPPHPVMEEGFTAAAGLPDELVVEILARLPAKSLCRFKCVSRSWRALISDPTNRARLAQTLSGFFFFGPHSADALPSRGFLGLSPPPGGDGAPPLADTALSFLPPGCGGIELLDSCNGLLLLHCSHTPESPLHPSYIVCNPATGEWVALPQPSQAPGKHVDPYMGEKETRIAALGFDPAVSSHFHVFQLVEEEYQTDYEVKAVEIYSSQTGRWVLRESGWSEHACVPFDGHTAYLNGVMHLTGQGSAVAMVDTKGETWRVTHVRPRHQVYNLNGFVAHSQGHLLYVGEDHLGDSISIYALEDYASEDWTLKHIISTLDLFGPRKSPWWPNYVVVAFHPDRDLVFFYDWTQERLMSYDMTHRDVHFICTMGQLEPPHCLLLPYVPLYSRALASPNIN